MKLWRLFDSFHGLDLGQNFMQQSGFVEQQKSLPGAAFRQHLAEFIANPLLRHVTNLRCQRLNRLKSFGLDGVAKTRRKADGTQHPKLVLGKAPLGIANGSNDPVLQILLPPDEIQDLVRVRIEQQAIDGEIAALNIFLRIFAEANLVGMTAVAVSDVAAKRGNLDSTSSGRDVTSCVSTGFCGNVA